MCVVFVQVLFPADETLFSFNVMSHDVGQVTAHLLGNNTDRLNR